MRRTALASVVVLAVLAGLAWGGVALWRSLSERINAGCTFGSFSTDTDQAAIASTMVGVVVTRALPARAATLVVAAGLQESKLRNIPSGQGDRDSVGVLQQRPSQGWGTAAQLADVAFATGAFLDRLVQEPNWESLPLARAIQNVQISADEAAYAQHEAQAQAIADAFTGSARGIDCRFARPSEIAATTTVVTALRAALPVNAPTAAGRDITVSGASWTTAAWFVAHADQYGIDSVGYAGARWKRSDGWKDDSRAGSGAVVARMDG